MPRLSDNESFKVSVIGINNSNCSGYHGGNHGNIKDHTDTETYKVKKIHYGGIYDAAPNPNIFDGKGHQGTIETHCNCFIRYYEKFIIPVK